MTFLAPGFLLVAAIAAAGIVALHFIVTRRPPSAAFPTARFVPEAPEAARSRSIHFSDLLLLVVRVLAIMLAGAALARPVFTPRRERIVRVIAADVSGSAASVGEVRDSVRALTRPGDAVVAFDTIAWTVHTPDSLARGSAPRSPGSLSTGLVAALRAASSVREGADSVELVIVSPITGAEGDRATGAIRSEWNGRARLVPVAATRDSGARAAYPVSFLGATRPAFTVARNRIDTVGAVVAGRNVVVAPFERRWRFISDSLVGASVIARWADGEPAAIERDSAHTCKKSVLVAVDSAGDMPLRPEFTAFRSAISGPCLHPASAHDSVLTATLAGGKENLASASSFPVATDANSPFARWMLLLAIILAIVEMVLRRSARERENGL